MPYTSLYITPPSFDNLLLASDGDLLTGLHFIGSQKAEEHLREDDETDLPIFQETRRWLDDYFSGHQPDFTPRYKLENVTPFRQEVSEIMFTIPFGETMTYGEIAMQIAQRHGLERMSAQAVGGAVGWNPICLIVPCHRVMGAGGQLTGYGGGINNKIALLRMEASLSVE
ncbi:MAG: methylated-DNA--[protein]-cysteine S-methyltransferase [Paludibacteraceae bacterium]|nr:methylated-DNA--[protein]-cysteine S-methyltransferase [Paludibacteraceae bacterium]